jgi:Ribbon-helix-helix protein, copG family
MLPERAPGDEKCRPGRPTRSTMAKGQPRGESVRFVPWRRLRLALRGVSSMVEQRTFNPWVQGSSPWRPTTTCGSSDGGAAAGGISADTMTSMAMTLRLTDAEAEVLRRRAELERRPMQEVVRQAIREYVESHSRAELLGQVLDEELPRYAEALERLAQ